MKYLDTLKKVTKILFVFYLGIISAQATTPDCECGEPENVWFKISSADGYGQKVVQLDMTRGQSFSDPQYIYLIVQDIETKELVYIVFPNGGDWTAEIRDPMLDALEKEFNSLEEYLKLKGNGTQIQKQ